MEKLKTSLDNQESRMHFVDYWAEYVRTHSDQEWGLQHTQFINSLMKNAKWYPLTSRQYLEIKGEKISSSRMQIIEGFE